MNVLLYCEVWVFSSKLDENTKEPVNDVEICRTGEYQLAAITECCNEEVVRASHMHVVIYTR